MKRLKIYINASTGELVNQTGTVITNYKEFPIIEYNEWIILAVQFLNIDIVDGGLVVSNASLSQTATYSLYGDSDFNDETDLMLYSIQSNTPFDADDSTTNRVNITGDWIDGTTADLSQGQLTIRVDSRTVRFKEVIGDIKEFTRGVHIRIKSSEASENTQSSIASFEAVAKNTLVVGTPPEPTPTNPYVTFDDLNTQLTTKPNKASSSTEDNFILFDANGDLKDSGKGFSGAFDAENIAYSQTQNVKEVVDTKADKSNVLELDNTTSFTPSNDYEPSTKKYVDDTVSSKADKSNVLELDNTTSFTPSNDYEPSTKKYVDDTVSSKADKSNVLELDNTTAFTPDNDYEPATKKYVDDNKLSQTQSDKLDKAIVSDVSTSGISNAVQVTNIVKTTQADYDSNSSNLDANTLYFIIED